MRSAPIAFFLPTITVLVAGNNSSCFCIEQFSSNRNSFSLSDCTKESRSQQLSIHHREANGIGYNIGYSSLDLFFSLNNSSSFYPFTELQGHIFNDGTWAANGGVGFRFLMAPKRLVVGLNAFYDYREGHHTSFFNQTGAGLELLGTKWDLRLNGYIPVGQTQKKYFETKNAITDKYCEYVMGGADLELGGQIFRTSYVDMHSTFGGYYFSGISSKARGGFLRLKSHFTRFFHLEGQVSYDSLFKTIFQLELALNLPFGARREIYKHLPCSSCLYMSERLVEPVSRFEIIVDDTFKKKSLQ